MAEAAAEVLAWVGTDAHRQGTQWLREHRDALPPAVADVLDAALTLGARVVNLQHRHRGLYRQLQRALGITPSSERDHSGRADDDDEPRGTTRRIVDPAERLRQIHERSTRLSKWHRQCAARHKGKAKDAQKKLMKLEDVELSPAVEARLAREHEEFEKRRALGDGAEPGMVPHAEALMHGAAATVLHEEVDCDVDPMDLPKGAVIKQRFYEHRERLDFSFKLTAMDVRVEKLAVETSGGTTLVAGDLDTLGPPKMRITWSFLAHMAILVSQYAMPLNRFARLASSTHKRFTAAEICRYFHFVASHFVPIYNHLGLALANAPVLMGDDTSSLVLEVSRALAALDTDPNAPLPWRSFATAQQARHSLAAGETPTPALTLSQTWGFVGSRKDGKGDKTALHTTVLSGRINADDPKSTVVFYRTHLGGLGNILDVLVPRRDPDNRKLVVLSDLSTVNLLSDPSVYERFDIAMAGCSSHARRPFALHERDDPDLCAWLLHSFKGIAIYEDAISTAGRNRLNTLAVRGTDQREIWEAIREACTMLTQKWSRQTPLGQGARYVLRHYEALTYYLTDPCVPPTNNLSERMLRMEKLIGNNSLFRQTLEGRFALDMMRTVLQTCVAAEVNLAAYVMWVMRMPKEAVAAEPAAFTPMAFGRWWAAQEAAEARETAAV